MGIAVCSVMQLAGTKYENKVSNFAFWGRIKTPAFLTCGGGGGGFHPIPCHIMQYSFVFTEFTTAVRHQPLAKVGLSHLHDSAVTNLQHGLQMRKCQSASRSNPLL